MLLTKIKKQLHRGSLHSSALLLAILSFIGVNGTVIEALHTGSKHLATIVPVMAEKEIIHNPISWGGNELPTISGE